MVNPNPYESPATIEERPPPLVSFWECFCIGCYSLGIVLVLIAFGMMPWSIYKDDTWLSAAALGLELMGTGLIVLFDVTRVTGKPR